MNRHTQAQRVEILRLLRKAEYDNRTVTYQYRLVHADENYVGRPVDEWLDSLTREQAIRVIHKLQEQIA